MVATVMPAEERKSGAEKAPRSKKDRDYSTFRCYAEQAEKLNELADLMPKGHKSVADVLESHLDDVLSDLLIKLTAERLKKLRERKS